MPSGRPRRGEPVHSHPHYSHHNHPQYHDTSRPHAYFHVEFGAAWPARHPRRPDYARDYRGQSEPPPNALLWKDLPALPSNYRLGEGLPWDLGAEPAADPDDLEILPFTRPTLVPIEPLEPLESVESAARRKEDPLRKRNLEDLSAAMMTIDNGFESQWWNRGHKVPTVEAVAVAEAMTTATVETPAPAPYTPSIFTAPAAPPTQPSLGWAIAEPASMPLLPTPPSLPLFPSLPPHRPALSPSTVSPETHTSLRTVSFPAVPRHDLHDRRDIVSPESESASVVAPWTDGSHNLGGHFSNYGDFSSHIPSRRRSSDELFLTTGYYA
ncbi:hypothetical protein F503_07690 [Ophiostoma piceae UAMH 11346]|uniref:Uncharacterized protein n=1 Tax=Ophiostoma piceae (strain UAMH 11346) TaxID=1262450 RepID=S3BSG3_OPHP1|nr:hypothetical protein F503_07690 [Ophiostoma piceae UAMH 11346]